MYKRLATFVVALWIGWSCAAQTLPPTQVGWLYGIVAYGSPSATGASCSALYLGRPYLDFSVIPNAHYFCENHAGTYVWQALSSGSGTVTTFAAPSGSWPAWLVPTVNTATTTPSLAVAASAIPNSALANPFSLSSLNSTTGATFGSSGTLDGVQFGLTTPGQVNATVVQIKPGSAFPNAVINFAPPGLGATSWSISSSGSTASLPYDLQFYNDQNGHLDLDFNPTTDVANFYVAPMHGAATICDSANYGTYCPGSGLSGLTAGQVPIAATATTATSSKPLAGSGASIITGPASSEEDDVVVFTGDGGTFDSGLNYAQICTTSTGCGTGSSFTATAGSLGTGVSSVTCATATCTNLRGTWYVSTTSLYTGGTLFVSSWSATPTAYVCTISQNSGSVTTYFGVGHSVATTTGMTVSAGSTATNSLFYLDYSCQP
jgi:hypothetical protein